MEQHHYLGYEQPVGEHLKYLVSAKGRPIACLAWSVRRRVIWAVATATSDGMPKRDEARIRFIAYNTRFLILPWVRVEHLASHLLGRMAARISDDWQQMYGHPIYLPGDLHGSGAIPRDLLPSGQLGADGKDYWSRQAIQQLCAESIDQGGSGSIR